MRFVLFLINPFISGIHSLININEKYACHFLYLWFIVFGIAFTANNQGADSYRYAADFVRESNMTESQYILAVQDYFTFESNTKDIYTLTITFLVSRFTDNYHWTFFVYAIVFGLFYIKSLKYLVPYFSKTPFFYILLFLFCFSNPIFNINGVRFWTAAWIGVYAVLKIYIDKKYQYLALLAVTPLIHGSFFIWIFFAVIAYIIPKPHKILSVLYILSIFVSLGSYVSLLSDYSDMLPKFMSNMIWSYTESEDALEKLQNAGPLYARVLNSLPNLMLIILTSILIIKRKKFTKEGSFYSLVDKYIALVTLVNFSMAVPAIGHRFQQMTIPLLVLLWSHYLNELKSSSFVLYWVPVAYAYVIFYWIRHMISVTELYLYVLPAPITFIHYLF